MDTLKAEEKTISEARLVGQSCLLPVAGESVDSEMVPTLALLEADILLASVLGISRDLLLARGDRLLTSENMSAYEKFLKRRLKGEPIAYLVGKKHFYGIELKVDSRVLIPRPETELLVERALSFLQGANDDYVVVDIGTGSGAIILALMNELKENLGEGHLARGKWIAVDIDEDALEVAQENAALLGFDDYLEFVRSDLFGNLPLEFDSSLQVFLSNPPYIAETFPLPKSVADYEPRRALRAGPAGLDVLQTLILEIQKRITPQTLGLIEIGHDQRHALESLLRESGFTRFKFIQDLSGKDRVVEILGK